MNFSLETISNNASFVIALVALLAVVGVAVFYKLRSNDLRRYEFISIIVHKFRNPLTQIKWSINELRSGETNQEKIQIFNELENSSDKLVEMTSALMGLSSMSGSSGLTKRFEEFSLGGLIKEVTQSLNSLFSKKQIDLSISIPNEDITIKANKEGIKFIIQTMLENALAYTLPGGRVELTLEHPVGKVVVLVSDNGIGIETKDLRNIFTRSFRTKAAKEIDTNGFGIGLYLARSVARHHEGDMTVSSEGSGKGATFKLVLPKP